MAIVEVKVPQLSESVAEATLLQWKKKAGELVAIDEIVIEIETDKVVLEVPAPAAGVLAEIVAPDGSTVDGGAGDREDRHRGQGRRWLRLHGRRRRGRRHPLPCRAAAAGSKAGIAMPAAAKIMADNKLAAGSVPGTGKDGRVTKGDVLGAVAAGARQGRCSRRSCRPPPRRRSRCPRSVRRSLRRTSAIAPNSACR